jgi:hypothetical protein
MGCGLVGQLASAIRLLADYPQGLSMLLGSVPPPSCAQICEMLETARQPEAPTLDPAGFAMRVSGGAATPLPADRRIDSEDRFNRVIERAGGWPHVNEVARGWAKRYARAWGVIVDVSRLTKSRVDDVSVASIADSSQVGRKSVYRIIRHFPQELAVAILNTPVGGEFQLSPSPDSDAV